VWRRWWNRIFRTSPTGNSLNLHFGQAVHGGVAHAEVLRDLGHPEQPVAATPEHPQVGSAAARMLAAAGCVGQGPLKLVSHSPLQRSLWQLHEGHAIVSCGALSTAVAASGASTPSTYFIAATWSRLSCLPARPY
jgi:hypothetical protein